MQKSQTMILWCLTGIIPSVLVCPRGLTTQLPLCSSSSTLITLSHLTVTRLGVHSARTTPWQLRRTKSPNESCKKSLILCKRKQLRLSLKSQEQFKHRFCPELTFHCSSRHVDLNRTGETCIILWQKTASAQEYHRC